MPQDTMPGFLRINSPVLPRHITVGNVRFERRIMTLLKTTALLTACSKKTYAFTLRPGSPSNRLL